MTTNETPVSASLSADAGATEAATVEQAAELATELLGRPATVESDGAGGWLVGFNVDELAELQDNGWFGRENGDHSLEAEWV